MLQEFTKYTPFDHPEKQNQANQTKIFDRSVANASFSYYECDSGDAQWKVFDHDWVILMIGTLKNNLELSYIYIPLYLLKVWENG